MCGSEGAVNYKPQLDQTICNTCFDKDYFFDPLSKTKTGRKYIKICDELNKIEDYLHDVINQPELFSEMLVFKNVIAMITNLRRSLYNTNRFIKIPAGKALLNIDINDMLIKKRKRYLFVCKNCGKEFHRQPLKKDHLPKYCSKYCYKKSLHEVVNVSLLDRTANLLANVKDEDLQLLETLRG
jgi:hypothetical protein